MYYIVMSGKASRSRISMREVQWVCMEHLADDRSRVSEASVEAQGRGARRARGALMRWAGARRRARHDRAGGIRRPRFHAVANCKCWTEIGSRCASTSVFVNAHHSIGIRALLLV